MIIGTAGHIDHGKTALVRALTGVDTDRLPEERRRGITIELGFAPLMLPGIGRVGIVDVPGHEAFVRTMVAGATGIDAALLVVAADEGTMPQTREHLAILSLLGVRGGVIALTKRDLVDDEWLALVTEDVRQATAGSPLAAAPIVATSATSGSGLDALRDALIAQLSAIAVRDRDDLFRLPVDRAFTVRGTGTVVTGTVWSGSIRRDESVRIFPGGATARVRGIESFGESVDVALPGTRSALALAGVDLSAVRRGSVLVGEASWSPSTVVRADVQLLPESGALRPRTRVRVHLGTVDVSGRVVAAGGALASGDRRAARIILDEPIVARGGDRFVLRSASPVVTIGGGTVTDPTPPTLRPRPWPDVADAAARLRRMLDDAGAQGLDVTTLPVRLGITPGAIRNVLEAQHAPLTGIGDRVVRTELFEALSRRLDQVIRGYHQEHPLEPGAPLQALKARLAAPPEVADEVVRQAVGRRLVEVDGGLIRRSGWTPQLSPALRSRRDAIRAAIETAGREPPSVNELAERHGNDAVSLLRLLEREGVLVRVEDDRFYEARALEGVFDTLRRAMQPGKEYSPAELRELLGVSRKFLIPLLEYADRRGITARQNGGRVLGGT